MSVKSGSKLRAVHATSGRALAERIEEPRTFVGRGLGLMFRRRPEPGAGMLIRTNGIHMLFMRFAIDAVFLDRENRVRRVYRNLRPWIGIVPLVPGAKSVLELAAGAVDVSGVQRGDQILLESA